ncbi:MAG: tRNA (adenosine(37)-N6)-threonylcarbamoyltransferase complex dimerization subunit type 1 TsaB [Deltaproteobacteria bacterium]|nr:tRNA (adenosine(37)-N6)-threonylcarbamoyltransferase complex dimerization subunit type 1 TsaB [Deltaproteobacteria bacterium]
MLVLSWDTSTELTSLGLCRADASGHLGILETKTGDGRGSHSSTLPPEIDRILKRHGLKPIDLDLVAAGRGPGSFTGLRTGLALAKGLAMGAGIPALGISSLAVLAGHPAKPPMPAPSLVAPVIDARHGELFTRLFRLIPGSPLPGPLSDILVLSPDKVMPALRALDTEREGILLLGPALRLLPPAAEGFTLGPSDPPDPSILASQAAYSLTNGLAADCPPTPLYGRSPDIFKKWTPPARLPSQKS